MIIFPVFLVNKKFAIHVYKDITNGYKQFKKNT